VVFRPGTIDAEVPLAGKKGGETRIAQGKARIPG